MTSNSSRRHFSMNGELSIPQYLTHYYREHPFRTLTELLPQERARVIEGLSLSGRASRRLRSAFYFEQRLHYETVMYDQFCAKGGTPQRRRPHYAILGDSEIWQAITLHCLRIPLTAIPSSQLSFTYTDSWSTYVDRDLDGKPIPRKPQYGSLYRLEELEELFGEYGWPGDRWKNEPAWEHDIYVEAQIWSDEPLNVFLPSADRTA